MGPPSLCYGIAFWPQSPPKMENQSFKRGPLYSAAIWNYLFQLFEILKIWLTKKKSPKETPNKLTLRQTWGKAVGMLGCPWPHCSRGEGETVGCEGNSGWETRRKKTWSCLPWHRSPPALWVLRALLFNFSEEYVEAESTTSPSCYFVTTLQNT